LPRAAGKFGNVNNSLVGIAWLPWAMMASGLLILAVIVWQARRKRATAQPVGESRTTEPTDEQPRQDEAPTETDVSGAASRAESPDDEDIGQQVTLILPDGTFRDDDLESAVAQLAPYQGAEFAIKHLSNDEGSYRCSFEIEALLRRAGWRLRGHGVFMGRTPQPVGVIIQYPGETRPEEVEALAQCLQTMGHSVSLERYPPATAPTVLIGVEAP